MNTENTATLVAIDTETGGAGETQCTTHALISIGCAAYDAQGYLHTFHQLVLPEAGLIICPEAVAVNGYDRYKWIKQGAVEESFACIRLLDWIIMRFKQGGKVKLTGLAHNVGHDKGFIEAMLTRQGWRREWEETVSRRWRCSCAALGFLQDAGTLPAAGGASLDNLTALRTGETIDNVRAARGIHTADHDALQCLDGYRWLMLEAQQPADGACSEWRDPDKTKPRWTDKYLVWTSEGPDILQVEEGGMQYADGNLADWDEITAWAELKKPK